MEAGNKLNKSREINNLRVVAYEFSGKEKKINVLCSYFTRLAYIKRNPLHTMICSAHLNWL